MNVLKGSRIDGDIQVTAGRSVNVRGSTVDGDIQLFKNRRKGAKIVRGNRVDGNLQCKQNRPAPKGGGNRVEGDKEGQCSQL